LTSFILALAVLSFPSNQSTPDWHTLESAHFKIYYADDSKALAATLPAIFENEHSNLSTKLGLRLDVPTQVLLAPTQEKFNELTGHLIPDWGEGIADASRNLIILKTDNLLQKRDRLLKLVRHEVAHILIGRGVAQPETLPRWFNEGIAIYFSYDEDFAGGSAISKAILSNSVVPLNEIEELLDFQSEKARLAYEESYSAILLLEEEFGFAGITEIIARLKIGQGFDQAFEDQTGHTLAEFELDWLRYAERKYRWRFLLDFETYLWIGILLLFVSGFAAIKWRNRQTVKRWEEEDRLGKV